MKPKALAVVAALVFVASGAWAALSGVFSSPPDGAIAEDTVTIAVGDSASGPEISGPEAGMVVGAGLLLLSFGWHRAQQRRVDAGQE